MAGDDPIKPSPAPQQVGMGRCRAGVDNCRLDHERGVWLLPQLHHLQTFLGLSGRGLFQRPGLFLLRAM